MALRVAPCYFDDLQIRVPNPRQLLPKRSPNLSNIAPKYINNQLKWCHVQHTSQEKVNRYKVFGSFVGANVLIRGGV